MPLAGFRQRRSVPWRSESQAIACVQALLSGAGLMVAGIPATGILALLILLLGIVQVPAILIVLPTIIYVFYGRDFTAESVLFAVYRLFAGPVDNVLKPLMPARGGEAPIPVILPGALGGMATEGIIGLFPGAVMLAPGYQLAMAWCIPTVGKAAPRAFSRLRDGSAMNASPKSLCPDSTQW